jgi:hypothetical protein
MFDPWDEEVCCVAAAADGTVFITDAAGAWTVTAAGTLERLPGSRSRPVDAATVLSDGRLVTWSLSDGFRVLAPDGSMGGIFDRDSDAAGMWNAFDGDATRLPRSDTAAFDIEVGADGGWLLGDFGGVRYVTPGAPARLAVGVAPATRSARLPLTAVVEITQPARITVSVVVGGRTTGTASAVRPAGRWRLHVPGGRRNRLNTLHVAAVGTTGPPRVATDRFAVLPGDTLPMSLPRRMTGADARDLESIGGGSTVSTCRRFDARRIDCRTVAAPPAGDCQHVTAFRLRRDGIVTQRRYRYERSCRFRAHPRWEAAPPSGVPLPTD